MAEAVRWDVKGRGGREGGREVSCGFVAREGCRSGFLLLGFEVRFLCRGRHGVGGISVGLGQWFPTCEYNTTREYDDRRGGINNFFFFFFETYLIFACLYIISSIFCEFIIENERLRKFFLPENQSRRQLITEFNFVQSFSSFLIFCCMEK